LKFALEAQKPLWHATTESGDFRERKRDCLEGTLVGLSLDGDTFGSIDSDL